MNHQDEVVCRISVTYFKDDAWRVYQEVTVYADRRCNVIRPSDLWGDVAVDDFLEVDPMLLDGVREALLQQEFFRLEEGIPVLRYGLLDGKSMMCLPRSVKALLHHVDQVYGESDTFIGRLPNG